MKHRTAPALAVALGLCAASSILSAQVPFPTKSLGMAGAYTAVARGQESLFLNPANLGLADNPTVSLGLMQVTLGATLLGPKVDDLWDIVQYDDTPDERSDEILATLAAGYTEADLDLRIPVAAYQSGRFAMGIGYGLVNRTSAGRDLLELLFQGYERGRTDYRVGNTASTGARFWDFAVAWGDRFGPLMLGATGHYLRGTSVHRGRAYEPVFRADNRQIQLDIVSTTAESGNGLALDLGATLKPTPMLTFTGVVRNAVGGMRWSDERDYRALTLDEQSIEDSSAPSLRIDFNRSRTPLECPASATDRLHERACLLAEGLVDDVQLPRTAHLAAALALPTRTDVAVEYRTELAHGALGGWWDDLASVGIQQKIGFLGLRAGYATNLQDGDDGGTLTSAGVSLGALHLSVARVDSGRTDGSDRSGYIGSIGLSTAVRGKPYRY